MSCHFPYKEVNRLFTSYYLLSVIHFIPKEKQLSEIY